MKRSMTTVFCMRCGAEMRRIDDTRRHGETWPCYRWLTTDSAPAHNCPVCGEITSNLTTTLTPPEHPMTPERAALKMRFMAAFEQLPPAEQHKFLQGMLKRSLTVTSGTAEPVAPVGAHTLTIVKGGHHGTDKRS